MESTGCFKDGREVTSMMLFDTQANTLQFQKDEDTLVAHAESIADHIIEFNNEQSVKIRTVPVLSLHSG